MQKQPIISQDSLQAYRHIYRLLKNIQAMKFEEPEDVLPELKRLSRKLLKEDREDWIWSSYKLFLSANGKKYDTRNPFRGVQWAMRYVYGQGRKRRGAPVNWGYRFLLFVLVNDMYLLKGQPDYSEVRRILDERGIEEAMSATYENLRKDFEKIKRSEVIDLLRVLHEACSKSGDGPFLPPKTKIQTLPIDTLAEFADLFDIKRNKYLRCEEPLPEDYRTRLMNYRTFKKRNRN